MNEIEIKEAVKAFSFGFSAESVAEECDISVEQAREIQKNYSGDIEERRTSGRE